MELNPNSLRESFFKEFNKKGANKMAQGVKTFATKPGDLSFIPRTYPVEGENSLLGTVL